VFIGFLLWFRLVGIVILVAASWVATSARDADVPMVPVTAEERRRQEQEACCSRRGACARRAHRARGRAVVGPVDRDARPSARGG
jgi:membrane protein